MGLYHMPPVCCSSPAPFVPAHALEHRRYGCSGKLAVPCAEYGKFWTMEMNVESHSPCQLDFPQARHPTFAAGLRISSSLMSSSIVFFFSIFGGDLALQMIWALVN